MHDAPRLCVRCGAYSSPRARYCRACGTKLIDTLPSGALLGQRGRYRIEKFLGGGGFGQVYLACDIPLNRPCVVKRLAIDDAWSPEERQRVQDQFQREALLLATLNTPGHPNIPEIYEYLPEHHCLVMKYVVGRSLGQVLSRRAGPLPVETALSYARDVCAALIDMHRRPEPVLHRDIKPDNILIDETGRVWLIDYGLSSSTRAGGTFGFTPPEQWAGKTEPRSDIYALAMTLYVMLTNTFPERELRAAMARGEDAALPPLHQINPAVGPEIEQLIQRGLAVAIDQRPSAQQFLAGLEAILNRPVIPPTFAPDRPPEVQGFVGRAGELAELSKRLARDNQVVLTGLAGVGKTCLAVMLARGAGDPGRVFWHTCHPHETADRMIRTLAAFLTEHGQAELLRLLQHAAQGHQFLSFEQTCDYLLELLRGRHYLLCLDDVQLVDDDGQFRLLAHRLHTAARAGELALIVTARQVPAWVQSGEIVPLPGLNDADARSLLQSRGAALPTELASQLLARTEGNAKLLHLAIDVLQRAGDPARLMAALAETNDIAGYLLHQVHEGLSEAERAVMSAVAVLLGYGGSRDAIEFILGIDDGWDLLTGLRDRYLLIATPGAGGVEYVQHAMLRSFYYQRLSQRRRRDLHRRAGEYYASRQPDVLKAARHFVEAGEHLRAAQLATADTAALIDQGEAEPLRRLLEHLRPEQLDRATWSAVCTALGEVDALMGDYEVARGKFTQALRSDATLTASPAQVEAQARRYRLLALVGERTGAYEQAEADCRNGLALIKQLDQPNAEAARLHEQLATVLWRVSEFDAAEVACASGLSALPSGKATRRERIQLWQLLATIDIERGRYDTAIEVLERSLTLAQELGERALLALVQYNLGTAHHHRGEAEQAGRAYQESLRIRAELGDVAGRIAAFNGLGLVHMANDEAQEAIDCFTESSALCERLGMPGHQAMALLNLGQLQLEHGRLDAAQANLKRACAIYTGLNNRLRIAHCCYLLGDLALLEGQPGVALDEGTQALALAQLLRSVSFESCALRVIGEALHAQGQLAEAETRLARAWQLQTEVNDPYDTALILAAWAALALDQGSPDLARSRAREALTLAQEQHMALLIARLEALLRRIDGDDERLTAAKVKSAEK